MGTTQAGSFFAKISSGGRKGQGLVHVAALLADLSFFDGKDVCNLKDVLRLTQLGMSIDCAQDVVMWYKSKGDEDGLEAFISAIEAGYELYKTQSKSSR